MDFNWLITAAAIIISGAVCYYFGMRYHGVHMKPKSGPIFQTCPHCGRNHYPTEIICPACGFVPVDRVVCWVFTGPACQRVYVHKDGSTLRPMVEGIARGSHPSDAAVHVAEHFHGLATVPEQWRTVALFDNHDKNCKRTAYMICIMPSDNGKGGIIVDRVQFPDQIDNAILRLTTRAIRNDEELTVLVV